MTQAKRAAPRAAMLLFGACQLWLAGCASPRGEDIPPHSLAPLNTPGSAAAAAAAQAIPQPAEVLALDAAATAWLDREVGHRGSPGRRARRLIEALFGEEGLGISYRYSGTMTATETFHAGSGNCLSVSNLVVAAARYLGLSASFQEVTVEFSWTRVGSLYFMDRHINVRIARVGRGQDLEVDMLPYPSEKSSRTRLLEDATAIAHFYNNRAGEALTADHPHLALAYFRQALESDPGIGFIWANLGTLYGRFDQFGEAERVLNRALAENPDEYVALNNLAAIHERAGKAALAEEYREKVARIRRRNPYHLAELAAQDYRRGDYRQALEQISRALELNEREFSFHLLAARIQLRLGDAERADWHLQQARRLAPPGEALPTSLDSPSSSRPPAASSPDASA